MTAAARPLRRKSLAMLIDSLGDVRAQIAAPEADESTIKAEITARRVAEGRGDRYVLSIASAARWVLNAAQLNSELGEDAYNRFCRTKMVVTFRTKPIAPRPAVLIEAA